MTFSLPPVAVPSWIVPGTAADSARLLRSLPTPHVAGWRVAEIGLCCFEGEASLAAPMEDYPSFADIAAPSDLAADAAPLTLHVHLPLNLEWNSPHAVGTALALMRKFSPLGVTRAVLHPPPEGRRLFHLRHFIDGWHDAGLDPANLLLENDAYYTAPDFLALLDALPVNVCVDVAHLMAYGQDALLTDLPPERVALLHWSAPGSTPGKDAHRPLTQLTPGQRGAACLAARRFAHALPLVEVFDWGGVCESLPVLRELYGL